MGNQDTLSLCLAHFLSQSAKNGHWSYKRRQNIKVGCDFSSSNIKVRKHGHHIVTGSNVNCAICTCAICKCKNIALISIACAMLSIKVYITFIDLWAIIFESRRLVKLWHYTGLGKTPLFLLLEKENKIQDFLKLLDVGKLCMHLSMQCPENKIVED